MTTTTPLSLSPLRPWLDTLHALSVRPVAIDAASSASSVASPRVRLVWQLPTGPSRSDMTKYLEAIELLVLLAWTDANALRDVAVVLRNSRDYVMKHQWASLVLEAQSPVTVDGHDVKCGSADDIRALCDYLISPETTEDVPLSPEYYAVRMAMEAAIGLVEAKEIPVGLHFDPRSPWRARPLDALPSIAALGATQHKLRDGTDVGCRLTSLCSRIHEFHDDNFVLTTGDEAYLGQLAEIWSHGIRVLELPQLHLPATLRSNSAYVEALHTLLGIGREGCVRRVLVDRRGPGNTASTLLLALAYSTSVREVTCGFEVIAEEEEAGSVQQRRQEVCCMAYALFRADVVNSIAEISLWSRNLTMEHVDAMRQVLDADDPLIGLFPDLATSIQAHQDLSVTASCLLLDEPTASSNETMTTRSDFVFTNLRILNSIDGYWTVYLPGWGPARLQQSQGVVTRASRVVPVASKIRSIAELKLYDFPSGDESAVVHLLQLVGTNVKTLGLGDRNRDRMRDSSYVEILNACANVERLELNESAPHRLSVIAESFANGHCPRLKSLKLCIEFVTEGTLHEIAQMLDVLADKHHPMTKHLELLYINTYSMVDGPEPTESAVLDVVIRMLESNKHLTYLKLRLPIAVRDPATIDRLKQAFAAHHDVLIPARVAPLSGRHKAAFLSVVWPPTTGTTASATEQFDARIVSRIWAFAPERRRRVLDVTMPQLLEVAEED